MWAAEDRPDYKIEHGDPRNMTTSELLSLIVGTGTDKMNTVEIARKLMADNDNSLQRISSMSVKDLSTNQGICKSTARKILASLEIGRRMMSEKQGERPQLDNAVRIYNLMYPVVAHLDTEEFWLLLMNQDWRLIKKVRLSCGGLNETIVDIRVLMKEAVLANATIIAVCHNHPSGRLSPSKADDSLTNSISKACNIMRYCFADHVIITDGAYYSYKEQGKI